MASIFTSFEHSAAVDFIQQAGQTGSAQHLNAEISVVVVESEIHVADVRQVALLCVINFMRLESTRVQKKKWH